MNTVNTVGDDIARFLSLGGALEQAEPFDPNPRKRNTKLFGSVDNALKNCDCGCFGNRSEHKIRQPKVKKNK